MDLRACYDLFQLCSDSCLLSSALVLQYSALCFVPDVQPAFIWILLRPKIVQFQGFWPLVQSSAVLSHINKCETCPLRRRLAAQTPQQSHHCQRGSGLVGPDLYERFPSWTEREPFISRRHVGNYWIHAEKRTTVGARAINLTRLHCHQL